MPHIHIPVKNRYSQRGLLPFETVPHDESMKFMREIRKARGLSQVQLADAVGVTQGSISKMESGEMNPTLDVIEAVAKALNVSPVELFGLPETQQRALMALSQIPPDRLEAALIVLEAMTQKTR